MLTTSRFLPSFRYFAALGALILGACAATQPLGENIPSPRYAVGDHWEYRITDGLRRNATSQLDVQVTAINAGIATLRLIYTSSDGSTEKTEQIDPEGSVHAGSLRYEPMRPFSPPLKLIDFPIGQRSSWRQTVDTFRKDTQLKNDILIYGQVQGRTPVTVPAGTYDAVAIYRIVQFDDDEFWRSRTTRRDTVRYAPEVKGVVREVRDAEYVETRSGPDPATIRTEHTTMELVSFTPGK